MNAKHIAFGTLESMSDLPKTKKQLGQHWLSDEKTLQYIVSFADVASGDTVLEVGPGAGTLTRHISKKADKVIAVEFDNDLAPRLADEFANTNVHIIHDDILRVDFSLLPPGYKVVANIPYYLTSNLLRVLLESTNPPSIIVLLIQKEVAERVAAGPGNMSLLAVSAQFYADVELGDVVSAKMFTPPPKVESQVIKLIVRPKPKFEVDTRVFFRLVKAGFSEKRKKLRSSISGGLGISKLEAEALLIEAGVDYDLRAQQLSLDDWHSIYQAYTQK